MQSSGRRGLADSLLGLAFTILVIAVLLYVSVHLIESILPVLLIILGLGGSISMIIWIFRRSRQNRYW